MGRLKIAFPYLLFGAVAAVVVATNLRGGGRGGAEDTPETPIDPVCHMEVNPTWGFEHEHQGRIVRFCSQRCQALFEVGPDQYLQEQCLVCREPVQAGSGVPATYMNKTYMLDSQACRDRFKTEPGSYFMHTMWGIPDWLYYVSIGVVLLVSFLMFEGTALFRRRRRAVVHLPVLPEPTRSMHRNAGTGSDRIDLMRWAVVRTFLRSRPARAFVQLFVVCVFLLIIAAGLFGNQNPALNIAPLLTWIEIGFGVTMRPAATAWLALAMLSMAIVCAFVFDRKSFCRYGCLVGRVSGLYALFAGVEVRRRDDAVCGACRTRECVRGSDVAYACPTFENPAKMHLNTYCIQCTECLQSCPHGNMTVKLRPWGADLAAEGRPRKDEAYLALLMLAISSFHGLTMTPVWGRLTGAIESFVGAGRIVSFTIGMAALMAAPILIYAVLVALCHRIALRRDLVSAEQPSYGGFFVRYAYCLLPIALFYHLAHNLEHMLMEGPKAAAMISDPFGWGWNVLGTASWRVPPLVSLDVLWLLQVLLVGIGHVYSLWSARKISRRTFADPGSAARGQWPMLIGMIAFSVFSLWLLKQPMEMRTSAM